MKLLNLFVALLFLNFSWAQTEVETTIREATVFLQSAQVTRTGTVTIPAGRGSIILTGLSPQIDHNSVRLGATGDFTILTVTPRKNFLTPNLESPEFIKLNREKEGLANTIARRQIDINILQEEENVIMTNKSIGNKQGWISVDELQKLAEYVRVRVSEIRNKRLDIKASIKKDNDRITQLNNQLHELRKGQSKNISEVVVQYQAERSTKAEFQLTYLVNGASWSPTYDLRVADLSKAVDLSYGALVNQATGEDWKEIILTLSTGNPRQQQNAPKITTWWLSPNQAFAQFKKRANVEYDDLVQMSNMIISEEEAEEASYPGADVSVNMTNTEFKVRLAQDIPSNGQQYRVLIDDYELPADYQYYAAPKHDCHVYLTARVTDWQKYSLLPGEVNLFFDGAYVGKSNLQTQTASDTLVFSLGRDKGLTIERIREEDYRDRRFFGSKIEQRIGWTIKVKKNRKNDIPLIIEDQIPVSTSDQIEVELEQSKGATYDETTGKLRWELKIKFGDSEKIGFRYSVKHPKNISVYLE